MSNTDVAWEEWGKSDPYFGVLSVPQFRGADCNTAKGFFESGAAFIGDRLEAARAAFGPLRHDRALDFGCGVGRLLIPLAGRFTEAVGVDISQAMRSECRRNLDKRAIANARLLQSDDELSEVSGAFDFVNSQIVLQHIPVNRGYRIMSRLLSVVAPGGVISLQFTVDRGDGWYQAAIYWAQRFIPGVQTLTNVVKGRRVGEPLVQMNEYDLPTVIALYRAHGMEDPVFEWGREGRVLSITLMARRSEGREH